MSERTLLEAALARLDEAAMAVTRSAATDAEQHQILGCLVGAYSLLGALSRVDPAAGRSCGSRFVVAFHLGCCVPWLLGQSEPQQVNGDLEGPRPSAEAVEILHRGPVSTRLSCAWVMPSHPATSSCASGCRPWNG
jgi:hypothetical protein